MSNEIDHPKHYGGADNPYEVIKVLEAWLTPEQMVGFLKGNIIKYLARADLKGGKQDVGKAGWYAAYLNEFEARHPSMAKADGAIARQLRESVRVNGEIRMAVRALRERLVPACNIAGDGTVAAELDNILRIC